MNQETSDHFRTSRRFEDIRDLFGGVADPNWAADRDLIDGSIRDPWDPRDDQ